MFSFAEMKVDPPRALENCEILAAKTEQCSSGSSVSSASQGSSEKRCQVPGGAVQPRLRVQLVHPLNVHRVERDAHSGWPRSRHRSPTMSCDPCLLAAPDSANTRREIRSCRSPRLTRAACVLMSTTPPILKEPRMFQKSLGYLDDLSLSSLLLPGIHRQCSRAGHC